MSLTAKFTAAFVLFVALYVATATFASPTTFLHPFAPTDSPVTVAEQPYRGALCLNGQWQFQAVPVPQYVHDAGTPPDLTPPTPDAWDTTPIKIPSPWNVNTWGNGRDVGEGTNRPYVAGSVYYPSYPAAWDRVAMAWMRRVFSVPSTWPSDRRLMLHFDAVAGDCEVVVNGQHAGHHFDSFMPFDVDVTNLVHRGGSNELLVGVRSANMFNLRSTKYPAFLKPYPDGSALDGISGIWQDVYLMSVPQLRVAETFVQPLVDQGVLKVNLTVRNDTDSPRRVTVGGVVRPWVNLATSDVVGAPEPNWRLGSAVLSLPTEMVVLAPNSDAVVTLTTKTDGALRLWSPNTPNLYGFIATTRDASGVTDSKYTRFGWRQLKIQGSNLMLNGTKIQLTGDICHPFGPFMMSRRFAWAWFKNIKDWGGNAVRLHAQPYPHAFLDMADEMGIMVLDEDALFGSSIALNLEEPTAWDRFDAHFDGLVMRDRNHPCVFGWSFGNEMFAVLKQASSSDADYYRSQLVALGQRAYSLDPTRPWISCDGDQDLNGALPDWSRHFGLGLHLDMLPPASIDKPLMVGESGGTYYARPSQMAVFNGENAYRSYADRNDALGIDAYQNVVKMARPLLAYFSASETVWFGNEHLNLGYHDFSRLPNLSDGVFFGPYIEGQGGMQLERIPPYVATLNPGWDSSLPLYKPLSMFNAMKAAMHQPDPAPCQWDHIQLPAPRSPAPEPTQEAVSFAGDKGSDVYARLVAMGVPFTDHSDATQTLIIDGQHLAPPIMPAVSQAASAMTARGGTVLILVRDTTAPINLIDTLLPFPAALTDRQATMLERGVSSPWVDSFGLPNLYFAEDAVDHHIEKCGIGGAAVAKGSVLLTESNTDWSLFNNIGEISKCGAVELAEAINKPSGASLVVMPQGTGKVALSAIDYLPDADTYQAFWKQLLSNIGIKVGEAGQKWLLRTATASDSGTIWRYTTSQPSANWQASAFDDSQWNSGPSGFGDAVPNSKPRTTWRYTPGDIWLRTTFNADERDIANAKMLIHHDEGAEVFVNGTQIFQERGFLVDYKLVDLSSDAKAAFHAGLNTVAVHCHQIAGGQYIDVGFISGASVESGTAAVGHNLLLNGPQN